MTRSLPFRRPSGLIFAAVLTVAVPAWGGRSVYAPYPGAELVFDDTDEQKAYILKIDLGNKKVRVRVTSPEDALKADGSKRPMGPDKFAVRRHLQMAINGSIGGDPGGEPHMHVNSLVKGYGQMWPLEEDGLNIWMHSDTWDCSFPDGTTSPCSRAGLLAISADNQDILMETVGAISFPDNVVPPPYDVAAGGRPVIVWDGVVVDNVEPYTSMDDPCTPSACSPQPRTAYGVSQDKKTLFLVVVGGREETGGEGKGMTTKKLGQKLRKNGAWWAFNLDGGGSSAMYVKDWQNMSGSNFPSGIVNKPSDGSVRTVPLQIGIQIVQPRGHLEGTVRKGNPNSGTPIAGATVTVTYVDSDGATQTKSAVSDPSGHYGILAIDAGRPAVKAVAKGYKSLTYTKLIAAGDTNRLDIGLASNTASGDGSAVDGLATPSVDLEDTQGPDTARRCFGPVPADQLATTDKDPDFPNGQGGGDCIGPVDDDCASRGDCGDGSDAGGAAGSFGAAGTGGWSGTAGGVSTAGTGGNDASAGTEEHAGGCGCRTVRSRSEGALPLPSLLSLLALGAWRARRTGPRRTRALKRAD